MLVEFLGPTRRTMGPPSRAHGFGPYAPKHSRSNELGGYCGKVHSHKLIHNIFSSFVFVIYLFFDVEGCLECYKQRERDRELYTYALDLESTSQNNLLKK